MKLKKKKKPRDSTKNSEAAGSNAQHYRSFASNLDRITDTFWKQLGKTMQEDLLEVQQGQVETLIKLEHAFKLALIKHRWGILAYRKFVDYIRDDRQNILDARPFFRERQTTFTAEISPALRDRRARGLFRFRVNWRFVMFVVQSYKWGASSEVRKIAEQIRKVRDELITVNLPLGLNRVKKFWAATQRSHLERMDLVQIACEGLMSAVDKFVPPFTTAFRDVIIGRITGNFIEQYSQTLIHFYPDQRRKLYRAHSFIGKNPDVKTSGNFHDMVHKVNHGVEDKSRLTNESEIANLLAAASVVSLQDTDSSGGNPQGEYNGHSGNGNTRQIEKYAAPEESQPDVRVEEADCLFKLHAAAVTHLSLREKKLLMLKGISLDLLSQEKGGFREKDCQ